MLLCCHCLPLFSLLPKPQTHKHHTMWLWEASVKTQCVLKCKSVDHKHVWMQRERAGKKGWWKVCTQTRQWLCHSSMTVWWLVTLLAWWWLQCVVEWMWNARECGDAHKRLIAPRWFERKEAQCLVNHIHQSKPTPTHQLVSFVQPLPQLVCALCLGVFLWCVTRGLAQSKHQALVMAIASSKPINLNPHHVHVFVLCSCNNSAWSLVQHGCLLNAIADAGVWLFTLAFKPNTTLTP